MASTAQFSAPARISLRSARCPRSRLSAPMMRDLPAPVSPVRVVKPASNSRVTSSANPKFLMRSAVSMEKDESGKQFYVMLTGSFTER